MGCVGCLTVVSDGEWRGLANICGMELRTSMAGIFARANDCAISIGLVKSWQFMVNVDIFNTVKQPLTC
jgi:hypothetical protein